MRLMYIGCEAVVRLLLERGAEVNAQDWCGWTALGRAAARGHEVVVQLLLEHGADGFKLSRETASAQISVRTFCPVICGNAA
jgi:ankyrin repeat protein